MTSKERAALRAQANSLEPLFQVGKGGVNDALIAQTLDAFRSRELLKLKVLLETAPKSPRERESLRALQGVSRDLDAALAALDRNPGCPRAVELVRNQIGRQEQSLRDVFIERTL